MHIVALIRCASTMANFEVVTIHVSHGPFVYSIVKRIVVDGAKLSSRLNMLSFVCSCFFFLFFFRYVSTLRNSQLK